MEKALSIFNLSFSYPSYPGLDSGLLLNSLSLDLDKGGTAVILGRPDSGKSTLAGLIAGLIPEHTGGAVSGTVLVSGSSKPAFLSGAAGIVFQDPERQTVTTRCDTEVAFPLEASGVRPDVMPKLIDDALGFFGLAGHKLSPTYELSGGEKKKLALAGLYASAPELWVLDETLEELDLPSRQLLLAYLKRAGITSVITASKFLDVFNAETGDFYLLSDGVLSGPERPPFSKAFMDGLNASGIMPCTAEPPGSACLSGMRAGAGKVLAEMEGIDFSYGNPDSFRLKAGNFRICAGETVAVVGGNGSGKSTLARILCGLLEPDSGTISGPEGVMRAAALNTYTAYIFQNPDYQIFLPTVQDELSLGLKQAGVAHEEVRALVGEAVRKFRLPSAEAPPAIMSYGARKRLQAAVYYLLDRPVVIMDEADTGLSFGDFAEVLGLMRKPDNGIVIITHNLELAASVADRIYLVSGGGIREADPDEAGSGLARWMEAEAGL